MCSQLLSTFGSFDPCWILIHLDAALGMSRGDTNILMEQCVAILAQI